MLDREYLWGIARKINNPVPHLVSTEDLVQEGAVAACQAAPRYDPSRNVPLHLFLAIRAHGAMVDAIRMASPGHRWRGAKSGARPVIVSLDELAPHAMRNEPADESWSYDLELREEETARSGLFWRLVQCLKDREWEIVERHYFFEEQFQDIAEDWGISASRISQIHTAALERMRKAV